MVAYTERKQVLESPIKPIKSNMVVKFAALYNLLALQVKSSHV